MTLKELKKKKTLGKNIDRIIKNICGKKIGEGCYRDVYELKGNPRYVVKIEKYLEQGYFSNVTEWTNWINNKDWELGKWLAPCEIITYSGQVLIQRRVRQKKTKHYPKSIPSLFTDTKYANTGWIGKRFVFHDYSYLTITSLKMKKAKWWGEDDKNYTK